MPFSKTVQRNHMKFGENIAPNSSCLSPTLGAISCFSFGVESILLSSFRSPFKCTVDKELETLITLHSNMLCD